MKRMFAWLVVASMGLGVVACSAQGEDSSVDETSGALGANSAKCGGRTPPAVASTPTLDSHIGDEASEVVKLTTVVRDPAAIPVGARNPKYLTSLQLKGNGKFSAKLSNGTKMKGTYTIAAPRCMGANFEMLSLDPAGEEAEGLMFKVFRGKGRDFDIPQGSYGFVGDGFTPFNMRLDAQEEPVADSCDCDSLPTPRCMGEYKCLAERPGDPKECTWTSHTPMGCGGPI